MKKGQHMTAKMKKKLSISLKGRKVWNKGTKGIMPVPWNKGKTGVYSKKTLEKMRRSRGPKGDNHWTHIRGFPEETKQKIRNTLTGRKLSLITRKKMSVASLGKKKTLQARLNMSKGQSGERGSNWKGGITPINKKIRRSIEFRLWREAVFARDNWTCILCHKRGGELHPDHIKQFAFYPDLRFTIDNGRTLCKPCHQKTDTWGNRKKT